MWDNICSVFPVLSYLLTQNNIVPMNAVPYKFFLSIVVFGCFACHSCSEVGNAKEVQSSDSTLSKNKAEVKRTTIDTTLYKTLLQHISDSDKSGRWPVKDSFPAAGAVLPFNRIVAYYGNLYSKNMGILGELPKDSMLKKLQGEVQKWQKADTMLHAIPALHYIA